MQTETLSRRSASAIPRPMPFVPPVTIAVLFLRFISNLSVPVVSDFQPALYFIIDILQRGNLEAMRDAIFLGKAAGIDEPLRCFLYIAQGETKIDARLSRWFNLPKDVIAIERHDRLTRTRFHVSADAEAQ